MAEIVFVHGIGQENKEEGPLLEAWLSALHAGLTDAGQAALAAALTRDRTAMAYYGRLFRRDGAQGSDDAEPLPENAARLAELLAEEWITRAASRAQNERVRREGARALKQLHAPPPGAEPQGPTNLVRRAVAVGARIPPYDMGGGTTAEARPFDLSALAAGSHQVEALVRRGDGSTVSVTATFDKPPSGFTLTTVDSEGLVAFGTSIAIGADGLPVMSYFGRPDLKVLHCGTVTCSAGNSLTTVDSAGFVGEFLSIATGADGLPVVSYWDSSNADLKVAHCGNVTCTAGNTLTTVDSAGSVGLETSIAIGADGLPVMSYHDSTNATLRVAHCGTVTCTAGNTVTAVDGGGSLTSIAIGADGLPVMSYSGRADLKVLHCGNVTCTAGNTVTTVDSATELAFTSIAIGADGLAVVSYWNGRPNWDLKVAHCGTLVSCK